MRGLKLGSIECVCENHRHITRSRDLCGAICYVNSENKRLQVTFHFGQAIVVHEESV